MRISSPDVDARLQLSVHLRAAALRPDEEQPEQGEHGDDDDQLCQGSSCGPPASRASAAAVKRRQLAAFDRRPRTRGQFE